jgi:hypothetical protein
VTGQAQQQTAHDVPDRATTRFVPRKMRGEGNQNLHGRRAEADQKRNRETRRLGRYGNNAEMEDGNGRVRHYQLAVFEQVAKMLGAISSETGCA